MSDTRILPHGPAPEGDSFRMGARHGKTAEAWQLVWDRLNATEFQDGIELARDAAAEVGIKDISVMAHMRLAVREGYLETENRMVTVEVCKFGHRYPAARRRTFYRIGPKGR